MSDAWLAIQALGWVPYLAGAILAVLCGFLSVRINLHRQVFLSAALGQTASLGIAIGLFFEIHDPTWISLCLSFLTLLFVGVALKDRHTPGEVPLGIMFAAGSSGSILFASKSASGREEIMHLLEGDMLFATDAAVLRLGLVAVLLLTLLTFFERQLTFIGFDPKGAEALGYKVAMWHTALLTGIAVSVVLGMECGGLLFTFGCLVIPGAAILQKVQSIPLASTCAALMALLAHTVAYGASFHPAWDLPPAASTVMVLVVLYVVLKLFK